jgi:hypothetical protein
LTKLQELFVIRTQTCNRTPTNNCDLWYKSLLKHEHFLWTHILETVGNVFNYRYQHNYWPTDSDDPFLRYIVYKLNNDDSLVVWVNHIFCKFYSWHNPNISLPSIHFVQNFSFIKDFQLIQQLWKVCFSFLWIYFVHKLLPFLDLTNPTLNQSKLENWNFIIQSFIALLIFYGSLL